MQKPVRTRKPFPFHIVVFLLPAVIIYTLFMAYPLLDSLRLSLYDQHTAIPSFVGLSNFQDLIFSDLWGPQFRNALGNNFIFFAIHMLVQNPLALLLAALLTNRRLRGSSLYRTLIFTPTILSIVIIGFILSKILSPELVWGIFDGFLKTLGLGALIQPWLGSDQTALISVSLISVWQWVGLPMLLMMASLLGISEELLEAAKVDGATGWDTFWQIRFPLILPTIGIVSVLTFVGNFNAFDLIYTIQGPQADPHHTTDIMGTFFFRTFYGVQLQGPNPTMGTTIAAATFIIILVGVLFYMFFWQRRILAQYN